MTNSSLDLEASVNALVERLEVIETRYRRLRAALFAVVGALAILGLSAATSSQAIRTTRIAIVDSAGRERIVLGTSKGVRPYIGLYDASGRYRASLQLTDNQYPNMTFWDPAGTARATLEVRSAASDLGAFLHFWDPRGALRTGIGVGDKGNQGNVITWGSDGKTILAAMFDNAVRLSDTSGNYRFFAGGYSDGTFGANIKSATGSTLWSVP